MKIKKLSVYGFKSFMDRLEIPFPQGISGIVGPNGCGKSNVVDAIRWCMGEQSPKQMRGRRMEDIIFNGAGDQKPLGMTEVSLLFENGDGSFPPAFARDPELAVTRRLYRSGESEYLINNVPCRLKDIQEIFFDTGLGNKAYSIISQGQITQIVDQKPEETRVMLEEAAGITKYRRKVAASQRKIEQTEANLQRVEDILGEVQTQMRSFKRQASKARRYKAVCEEIRNGELILYANTYDQLGQASGDKVRFTEDLVQQEIAKTTEFARAQTQGESMNLELMEKDAALSELRKRHGQVNDRTHAKQTSLETLAQEMRMQGEMEARLKEEREDIVLRLQTIDGDRAQLSQRIETIEKQAAEKESEVALSEKRLKSRRESLKGVKEEYEEARERLNEGANRETGLSHESDYLSKMLDQITDGRSRLDKDIRDAQAKMAEVVRAAERKSRAREATSDRLREIAAVIEREDGARESLEEQKDVLETSLRSAEGDLNVCQSRLSSLQSLNDNFEGYQVGVRTIMKAEDLAPRKEGRVRGLLAELIRVEPRYEQAVESVLADKLQYVIVETQEDGRLSVEYLKERRKGRGSFVPLGEMAGRGAGEAVSKGSLAEVVTVSDDYRPLIRSLLNDTVLVDSLEEAISAWNANGSGLCYVTPEGDMVDQRGVVCGGKLAQRSSGILARKREISELKERSKQLESRVGELRDRRDEVSAQILAKKRAMEDLDGEKWTCQEEINDFDKVLFRLGQELDQLEKLSEKMTQDLAQKDIEERKHKRDLSRVETELQNRQSRHHKEKAYFEEKAKELKESEEEFDQIKESVARLRADYLIMREEQRGLGREEQAKEDYAEDSRRRIGKIDEELVLGRRRREESGHRQEDLREEMSVLYEALREAEEAVNRADRERQAFQDAIREAAARGEQVRQEMDALRENINQAKLAHSELRIKMDNLTETVKEKFDLDLPDIYGEYVEDGFVPAEMEAHLDQLKDRRQQMGEVNLTAITEHEVLKERFEFISSQREDLIRSIEDLQTAIRRINRTSLEKFRIAFEAVNAKLKEIFPILFNGGTAGLSLTDETRPLESGVLVEVQPPGKRLSHMGLLSGGEKALVAMALLFSIYMIKPSPFCLLDEVDAPLDEANIDRFNELLQEIKKASQIIMVTHSRKTMEIVDRLFGVTMERKGISKTVAVDLKRYREAEGSPAASDALH
ncbi:MAG: chromosome segregation protein SMC [Deltaproteobacteria bacterium]|nr:chromosome segregation protein SMC [Deltaproteobacteria bacterium]